MKENGCYFFITGLIISFALNDDKLVILHGGSAHQFRLVFCGAFQKLGCAGMFGKVCC